MSVKGVNGVLKNIKREFDNLRYQKAEAAVYSILLEGRSLADTQTPVDTSTLINSGYAPVVYTESKSVQGRIGYSAFYAGYVHEMPGKLKGQPRKNGQGNYWGPNGEPKFLTKAFQELAPDIPRIIQNAYKS